MFMQQVDVSGGSQMLQQLIQSKDKSKSTSNGPLVGKHNSSASQTSVLLSKITEDQIDQIGDKDIKEEADDDVISCTPSQRAITSVGRENLM